MTIADIAIEVEAVEAAGGSFRLDGEKVCVWYPDDECRGELARRIALLRDQRAEVAAYLKNRSAIPPMPEGVRLVSWVLKRAPVAVTRVEIVTDVSRFVTATLLQLKAALAGERWLAGNRSVRELIERLEECGVVVEVREADPTTASRRPDRANE